MSLKIPPQIATSFGDQLYRAFERWLFYKAGRGKKYRNQELQHLVLAIRAHAKRHGDQAVADLIRKSIVPHLPADDRDPFERRLNKHFRL